MASALEELQARMTQGNEVSGDFRGIIYGESGVGKTVFAMELAQTITPDGMGIVFADARHGWDVMANHPELQDRAMRLEVKDLDDLIVMAQALRNREGMFAYVGCIVIDELSVLSSDNLARLHRLRLAVPADQAVQTVPEWPDYNANQNAVTRAVEALQSVPDLHVIQVAHIKYDKDDRGVERSGPDFPKGLSANLRRDVHMVARFDAKIDRQSDDADPQYLREIQVHPSARVVAKTRVGGLPVKAHPDTIISAVAAWLGSDEMAEDLSSPEPQILAQDETANDGITAADIEDDEPTYVAD
jgi:hypothetical protein